MDPERGQGSQPTLNNHKVICFISILVQIPCKITKLTSQHSMLSHHRHARETPFNWFFAGGPMMARRQLYLDPKNTEKTVVRVANQTSMCLDPHLN